MKQQPKKFYRIKSANKIQVDSKFFLLTGILFVLAIVIVVFIQVGPKLYVALRLINSSESGYEK